MSDGGKGSSRRPGEGYQENYDKIFGKKTRLDKTGTVAVDPDYFWQPIETCPLGVKVQLLGVGGVATYGQYCGKDEFFTHWCPLPKLKK